MPEETTHKRRVRYKGTHPRTFEEKYKEHDPEKYADTVAKVIEKGSTPAGMHIPIMVKEILDFLQIRPGQKGLDATLGYGGHTRKMLEKLTEVSGTSELTGEVHIKDDVQTKGDSWENPEENSEDNSRDNPEDNPEDNSRDNPKDNSEEVFREKAPEGHLYALDVDPIEIVKTGERLQKAGYGEEILTILQQNFANLETVAKEYGPFDFMLADLGVSSMQIDDPKRGFSYKADGPLDLRLDPQHGIPASQRLRELNREELIGMLVENSDEPYAEQIASQICKTFKKGGSMDTTTALREAIERALCFLPENKEKKDILKKTCQRVFQALRIDVNSEFEVLEAFLNALPEALADGGRVAILTFHSGEDRLVKKAFQQYYREGIFEEILDQLGQMPLPPYITHQLKDKNRYQTVYAKYDGSAAAPTAGLHFTKELLQKVKDMGVDIAEVTLHVGLGTFRPVKVENVLDHHMHSEFYMVSQEAADKINRAKESGHRVIAVGTTSTRTLEAAADENGRLHETSGWTEIFIYPGYQFKVIDALITNFHLPQSTLVMLVSALAGREHVLHAYEIAVKEKYRFFSFGDAMLIK